VLGRVLGPLERAVLNPERLPAGFAFGIALLPCVAAGLWLFRGHAALMLAAALGIGLSMHLLARLLGIPTGVGPTLPALVGVGLIGPGAEVGWAVIVAAAAGSLELCRASLVPSARNETGILAYSLVFLIGRGSVDRYFNPGSERPVAEPVRYWLDFFGAASAPIDPVRLYVGNVAGPVFVTSLMAVIIATAWMWYSRRLSLVVLLGFVLGALVPIRLLGWNASFQLESAPVWFAVALILADRQRLPVGLASRPLLGFTAGVVTMALRVRGFAVEGAFLTVAGLQLTVSVVEGLGWTATNRESLMQALRGIRLTVPGRLKPRVAAASPPLQPTVAAATPPLQPAVASTKTSRRRVGALQPK
jgi:hypothetical protein